MDLIKQLTCKNPEDYEFAASQIIDNADFQAFEKLIAQDDFLFDFIKVNVSKRLKKACNKDNYRNLSGFLKYYSSFYEDFIAETFSEYADDEFIEELLDKFCDGTDEEKAYIAKFFSLYQKVAPIPLLKEYAYSDFEPLAINSAIVLSVLNEQSSIEEALEKLNSVDEFESLKAVKFISAYGEKSLIKELFQLMKKSSISEYIASEIAYLESFLNLLKSEHKTNTLLAISKILDGLGEIIPVQQIFNFQLYEIFKELIGSDINGKNAIILLKAKHKFNQLTENDEYLYDEDKNTKNEVNDIKILLNENISDNLDNLINEELNEDSEFVYDALDLITDTESIKPLLSSKNQTIILKVLEIMKEKNILNEINKDEILKNITNEDIKSIIRAL